MLVEPRGARGLAPGPVCGKAEALEGLRAGGGWGGCLASGRGREIPIEVLQSVLAESGLWPEDSGSL